MGSSIEEVEVLYQQRISSRDTNVPVMGLFAEDVEVLRHIQQCINSAHGWSDAAAIIDEHAGAIMQAWENGLKGRRLIEELNRFAEIADLTEPNLLGEWHPPTRLKTLVYMYDRAAIVLARRGDVDTGISELAQVNAVIRKLSVNVRSSIWRQICDSALVAAMDTANFIANDPNIPLESVADLAEHFRPLTPDEASFRNTAIFEYLTIRGTLDELLKEHRLGPFRPLKYNSSCRLLRNFCDDWIQSEKPLGEVPKRGFSVWPAIYPDIPVAVKIHRSLPWYYLAYNPVGGLLIEILTPGMDSAFGVWMRVLIYDDLLQIVFNRRLGKPVSLKARAYGEEYIVDIKGKRVLSPGPDGRIDTADDIKLPINPEVLGWEE